MLLRCVSFLKAALSCLLCKETPAFPPVPKVCPACLVLLCCSSCFLLPSSASTGMGDSAVNSNRERQIPPLVEWGAGCAVCNLGNSWSHKGCNDTKVGRLPRSAPLLQPAHLRGARGVCRGQRGSRAGPPCFRLPRDHEHPLRRRGPAHCLSARWPFTLHTSFPCFSPYVCPVHPESGLSFCSVLAEEQKRV